jgi:putative flavoprotein involved in K+ transport
MTNHYPVIIIGGGQSGLSISYCLKQKGIDHIIFEKEKIAHSWRSKRWDSFCLVTPNWQCQLPGYGYAGSDPQGFMQKDEVVRYIEDYAAFFAPPLKEGITVLRIRHTAAPLSNPTSALFPTASLGPRSDHTSARLSDHQGIFEVSTDFGEYTADQVVVAAGCYHTPRIPKLAERLPDHLLQIHSSAYKNPESLPDRAVLIVGTGQSGCQIAEDLHLAGKQVHLCVGSAPRSPRKYRGKDVVEWLDQMGYYDLSIDEHPQKEKARRNTNHYVTGRDGGREIDLRQFALEGMQLHGRLKNIRDGKLEFQDDLKQNLDGADAVAENMKKTIDAFIAKNQITAPTEPPYEPKWQPQEFQPELDYEQANIGTVIWSTGYESDFSWIEVPVFDGKGYPGHDRGVTRVTGLYFLGLPWLYTWGSARFSGIARDANYLSDRIAAIATRNLTNQITIAGDWSVVNEFLLGS